MRRKWAVWMVCGLLVPAPGCASGLVWAHKRPEITAVSLNPCDGHMCGKESGIPFYLPKPLLIISKNFRNIESTTTGLTDSAPIPSGFDDQSKYADLNARTNFQGLNPDAGAGTNTTTTTINNSGTALKSAPTVHSGGAPVSPGGVPGDGLAPDTFFTYQIVFVPDMTKRYGLKVRGGPGEIRAAMNLVNGWQFTGIGPFYMKDSATAQNILAQGISTRLGGQAAADVLRASADLAKVVGVPGAPGGKKQSGVPELDLDNPRVQSLSQALAALPHECVPMTLVNFAEIHVFEPNLTPDGRMEWREITSLQFNRDYLGQKVTNVTLGAAPAAAPPPKDGKPAAGGQPQSGVPVAPGTSDAVLQSALGAVFGVPAGSPAFRPGGGLQSGAPVGGVPAGGVNQNQVQVDVGDKGGRPSRSFTLFNFGGLRKEAPRAKSETRVLGGGTVLVPGVDTAPAPAPGAPGGPGLTPGGGNLGGQPQTGAPAGPAPTPTIVNQPVFNNQTAPVVPPPPPMAAPMTPPGTPPQ